MYLVGIKNQILMGTFTNAIIREIGRNYGKAISNSLLGDKHSNPVRLVGEQRVLCAVIIFESYLGFSNIVY